jgi:hypothetical protein
MEYRTPTGIAQQKGMPAKQLGSTRAVIEALPDGAVIFVAPGRGGGYVREMLAHLGRDRDSLRIMSTGGGPMVLLELPPETIIGIDVNAFRGVPGAVYGDMHAVLRKRFQTVHWG